MDATRRWLRRNRGALAVSAGVIGVGYVAGQYVISKIGEARERMISERAAKENLRRRFRQNQEDCTITVQELLPTITEGVLRAQPSESYTQELQMRKAQRPHRANGASEFAASEPSVSGKSTLDDEQRSLSSESYVHANLASSTGIADEQIKPEKSKAQLWHDLKISSLTRAFTLIYTVSLLSLLTRVQLNLLGRRSYLSSLVAHTSPGPQDQMINLEDFADAHKQAGDGNEFELNRQYLTFSWWLLHKGWGMVMERVESAVNEIFGPVKPTADISASQFSTLVLEMRKKVEGSTAEERSSQRWLSILLPTPAEEAQVLEDSGMRPGLPLPDDTAGHAAPGNSNLAPQLRHILDETADVAESPQFNDILTQLLDASFSRLLDGRVQIEVFKGNSAKQAMGQTQEPSDIKAQSTLTSVKVASILALITKEAHQIGRGAPNEYVQALEDVEELDALAAIIYSSNFESDQEYHRFSNEGPANHDIGMDHSADTQEAVQSTIVDRAAQLADTAWSGFESVWAKVTG